MTKIKTLEALADTHQGRAEDASHVDAAKAFARSAAMLKAVAYLVGSITAQLRKHFSERWD